MAKKKRECYILDGYNIIHAWPELRKRSGNLAEARLALVHEMAEYGAFESFDMMIVFDAMFTEDEGHEEMVNAHTHVIYTRAGETADSRIERLAYDLVRAGREVHVVTSDGAEQSVILGAGAYRIPAPAFRKTVRRTQEQLRREFVGKTAATPTVARLDVSDRLDAATAARLDALRKEKD